LGKGKFAPITTKTSSPQENCFPERAPPKASEIRSKDAWQSAAKVWLVTAKLPLLLLFLFLQMGVTDKVGRLTLIFAFAGVIVNV
jgi:hypothetical protein